MKNILITSAGKRVALTKAFKETANRYSNDIKVLTTDMNPGMAPAGYVSDGCFIVPRVTDEHYTDILLDLCIRNNVGMVIPTIDTELLILSKVKDEFLSHDINIIVSDTNLVATCRDKRKTTSFFENHNIRVPATVDKYNPTFPIFAKPYDGSLSTNLHYIKTPDDLTSEILNDPKLIFMEYIDKSIYTEYTVDMYYGRDNNVKSIVPRERIEVRAGEINKGRTAKNHLVQFLKDRLNHIDGCIGCICVQLFFDHSTNDIIGIEINPRFGGGYPLSYAAGANYPEFLIQEYFEQRAICYTDTWKDNMLMLRYDDAIFI